MRPTAGDIFYALRALIRTATAFLCGRDFQEEETSFSSSSLLLCVLRKNKSKEEIPKKLRSDVSRESATLINAIQHCLVFFFFFFYSTVLSSWAKLFARPARHQRVHKGKGEEKWRVILCEIQRAIYTEGRGRGTILGTKIYKLMIPRTLEFFLSDER